MEEMTDSRGVQPKSFKSKIDDFITENAMEEDAWTTIMIRHIPLRYSQEKMLADVKKHGFEPDFFYQPIQFKTGANLGYAFANFSSHNEAEQFRVTFSNFYFPKISGRRKKAHVSWAKLQGLEANLTFFSGTRVSNRLVVADKMGEAVPDNEPEENPLTLNLSSIPEAIQDKASSGFCSPRSNSDSGDSEQTCLTVKSGFTNPTSTCAPSGYDSAPSSEGYDHSSEDGVESSPRSACSEAIALETLNELRKILKI
jgi:hypothetical protein